MLDDIPTLRIRNRLLVDSATSEVLDDLFRPVPAYKALENQCDGFKFWADSWQDAKQRYDSKQEE